MSDVKCAKCGKNLCQCMGSVPVEKRVCSYCRMLAKRQAKVKRIERLKNG